MYGEADTPSNPSREPAAGTPSAREIDSRQILAGEREVIIRHGNAQYWLRMTNNGKLILTK